MEKDVAEIASARRLRSSRRWQNLAVDDQEKEVIGDSFVEELPMAFKKDERRGVAVIHIVGTPKKRKRTAGAEFPRTPKSNSEPQTERLQTPRRSVRKSIKPAQDYEDIVGKRTVRSLKKEAETHSSSLEDEDEEHRWTPAKVGRVSEKRKTRRGRRNFVAKVRQTDEQKINVDPEVLEVVANDEDENKENVEPEELLKNRKSPKEGETKVKRSNETTALSAHPKPVLQPIVHVVASVSPKAVVETAETSQQSFCGEILEDENQLPVKVEEKHSESQNHIELVDSDEGNTEKQNENIVSREIHNENNPRKEIVSFTKQKQLTNSSTCIVISPLLESDTPSEQGERENAQDKIKLVPAKPHREVEIITAEVVVDQDSKENDANNSILETSDCVIISPPLENSCQPEYPQQSQLQHSSQLNFSPQAVVPSLISDDDENEKEGGVHNNPEITSKKLPTILINNQTQLSPATAKRHKKIHIVTPITRTPRTPSGQAPKPHRFPTPYRSIAPKQLSSQSGIDKSNETAKNFQEQPSPSIHLNLTSLEAKEFVMRSIRKRSFSACCERPTKKQLNRVKFHSPANQTVVIEKLDLLIAKSTNKGSSFIRQHEAPEADTGNVTQRRKRSLSVDEYMMPTRLKVKQAALTPTRTKVTPLKLQPRSKIPNFAAIHQRQFNKMENVVDHVMRKAERAKELINSSSKMRSAHKTGSSSNNQNVEPAGGAPTAPKNTRVGKPKALKKIDLSDNVMDSGPLQITKPVPSTGSAEGTLNTSSAVFNLPNPCLMRNLAIVQPITTGRKLLPAKKAFKPAQETQQSKPPFNLSTAIKKSTNCSLLERAESTAAAMLSGNTKTLADDKVASRRQRHMDMFKGRSANKRAGAGRDKGKSSEIIRGVRSNRRFELQMQHRKNITEEHI